MPHIKAQSPVEWHYEVEGEGDDLFFIHGWGVDKRIWRQQTKFFSQFYRVIAVDLPGHGKSSWEDLTLEMMAHDIKIILDHVKAKKITVIGSSLGGLMAMKLYELYPDMFVRMVFVGAMPKFSKTKEYPHGLDMQKMKNLGNFVETDYPSIINVFFRSLFTREERQSRRFKWLQKFRQTDVPPLKPALLNYLEILEHEDLTCPPRQPYRNAHSVYSLPEIR